MPSKQGGGLSLVLFLWYFFGIVNVRRFCFVDYFISSKDFCRAGFASFLAREFFGGAIYSAFVVPMQRE